MAAQCHASRSRLKHFQNTAALWTGVGLHTELNGHILQWSCEHISKVLLVSIRHYTRGQKPQVGTMTPSGQNHQICDEVARQQAREGGDRRQQGQRSEGNNRVEPLPVSAVLLRLSTFKMSLVIFLMVCRASSRSLPTPYRTTSRWLHSWLALSSWRRPKDKLNTLYWNRRDSGHAIWQKQQS